MVRQALAEQSLQAYTDSLLARRETAEVRLIALSTVRSSQRVPPSSLSLSLGWSHHRARLSDPRLHVLCSQDTSTGAKATPTHPPTPLC